MLIWKQSGGNLLNIRKNRGYPDLGRESAFLLGFWLDLILFLLIDVEKSSILNEMIDKNEM